MLKKITNTVVAKVVLTSAFISLFLIVMLFLYSTLPLQEKTIEEARTSAINIARIQAKEIEKRFEKAMSISRTLANGFSSVCDYTYSVSFERRQANALIRSIIQKNKSVFGIYTIWETNAFDRNDQVFAGTSGTDKTGRLIPYWTRNKQGLPISEIMTNYEEGGIENFYQISKKTLRETIIEPEIFEVQGKNVYLVSLIVPIICNETFKGVVGVDYTVNWLQDNIINNLNLSKGEKLYVISNKGIIVSSTLKSIVGRHIKEIHKDYENDLYNIKNAKESIELDDKYLEVQVPIKIGNSDTPWGVNIEIPFSKITNEVSGNQRKSFIFYLLGFLLSVLIMFIIIKSQLKPLVRLIDIAKNVANGNLNIKQNKKGGKEIKEVEKAFYEIVETLKERTNVLLSIKEGDFEQRVIPKSEDDKLAFSINYLIENLKKSKEKEEERRKELEIKNWHTKGIAHFSKILQIQQSNISLLSMGIIKELSRYVEATIGAVFLVDNQINEDDININLEACFAYNKERQEKKQFKLNEGIIGRCVSENQMIYMTEIPENYIKISSGLGERKPKSLLVLPLKNNNEKAIGAIELAWFRTLEKYEITFLQKLSENITVTIESVINMDKTKKLFQSTKQQSEMLAAQEEEMRQNIEELQATQETLSRKEEMQEKKIKQLVNDNDLKVNEIKGIFKAIKSSALLVIYSPDGKIIEINEIAANLLQKDKDELINIKQADILDINSNSKEYIDFWKRLNSGETIKKINNITIGEKDIWVSESYTPVLDDKNEIVKIINIGEDISLMKNQEFKLHDLLEKANLQTKHLAQKEAELRKNMSQLERIQDEINEKNNQLESNEAELMQNLEHMHNVQDEMQKKEKEQEIKTNELLKKIKEQQQIIDKLKKQNNENQRK